MLQTSTDGVKPVHKNFGRVCWYHLNILEETNTVICMITSAEHEASSSVIPTKHHWMPRPTKVKQ